MLNGIEETKRYKSVHQNVSTGKDYEIRNGGRKNRQQCFQTANQMEEEMEHFLE
jgi:hypothetical protein